MAPEREQDLIDDCDEDEGEIEEFMEDDMDKEDEKHSSNDLTEDEEADDEIEKYKVENFMKDGKHYSHDHPLRLMSRCEDDDDDDDNEAYNSRCRICGLPILSCPSYTCSQFGCKFFLHQPCALKLPTKLIHSTHGPRFDESHALYIQQASTNFIYKCEDCNFALHPLVAFPHLEIKTKHKSHLSHSLVAFCKEISCECDACGREQRGFFFHCGDCNFWIHPDCTILPTVLHFADHRYHFILAYSLPPHQMNNHCIICEKKLVVKHNGVYFDPQSSIFAHAACGSTHKSASQTKLESILLPDDEWDTTFPSSVIRRYAESNPLAPLANKNHFEADDDDRKLTIEKYHNHPLILIDDDRELARNLSCDLCTRTINNISSSNSFYKCDSCHFVAHKICADILPMLKYFFIPVRERGHITAELCPDPSADLFNSVFHCVFCRRPCNGLCYHLTDGAFKDRDGLPCWFIDLECMAAPSTINHASHAQHLLFRTHRLYAAFTPLTCCPDDSFLYDVYKCILCDYYIHVRCSMLPKTIIRHEYDEHPLHLVFTTTTTTISCCCFCEVCEKDIDLKYWLYRCGECDKSFHINCIPSVGYFSKVKFGGMLSLPDAHIHPLVLTRMLTVPTQRCGRCNHIIQGLLDQMAFSCEHCYFWLHFSCARDAAATPKTTNPLRLYWEIDFEAWIRKVREQLDSD